MPDMGPICPRAGLAHAACTGPDLRETSVVEWWPQEVSILSAISLYQSQARALIVQTWM